MSGDDFVRITDIPESIIRGIVTQLAPFVIGFARVEELAKRQEVYLAGSGTLVRVGNTRAILTAAHVVESLPKTGRIGVILQQTRHATTIDTRGLVFKTIARGAVDADGPDLGAIVLPPNISGTIGAIKTFYNLDTRREQALKSLDDLEYGAWCTNGFIDEWTAEEHVESGPRTVRFYNLTGWGGPDGRSEVGGYDYYSFPVSLSGRAVAPERFGGMSGGGVWRVPITMNTKGEIGTLTPLLSGVVFYQYPTTDERCGVKCHGAASVYRAAYDALA